MSEFTDGYLILNRDFEQANKTLTLMEHNSQTKQLNEQWTVICIDPSSYKSGEWELETSAFFPYYGSIMQRIMAGDIEFIIIVKKLHHSTYRLS